MRVQRAGAGRASLIAAAVLFAVGMAAPASATTPSYNNADISIRGGNAAALGGCINYAKAYAKASKRPRSNTCASFATAVGGKVVLEDVSVNVIQEGGGKRAFNNAEVGISGGDAVAVSGCVNYLQGTATSSQVNQCKTAADAKGGSVSLRDVDITVIQTN